MLRRVLLVVSLLTLATSASAQQRPAYFIETRPSRKVETTYTYEIRYPNADVKEWELIAARPRDLPSQTVAKVVVEPAGEELKDDSLFKQPVFRVYFKAETEEQKKAAKLVVRTEATLMSRKLVPLPAAMKAPVIPPLDEDERRANLASSPRLNYDDASFQKWLDTNKLRRQKN